MLLPAVEAEAYAALSGRSPAAAPQMWERLKAMGVGAVILREESAAELVARGEVLHFSRAEVEKWRALGFVANGAGPKPDSLWAKNSKALSRLSSALAARGIDASTSSIAGSRALELPPGVDLGFVPAGFAPETVTVVSAAGLIPVAASTSPSVAVAGQNFWIRSLPAASGAPELMRAAHGRSRRLLILRPSPGLSLEDNLERLREALRIVRRAGFSSVLPAGEVAPPVSSWEAALRLALFYMVGLFGPLIAARVGLRAERGVHAWVVARAPIATPVPQIIAGLAAVWAAASAAGLLAWSLPDPGTREAFARGWSLWTLSAPLAVGAVALFAGEGPSLESRWRAPLRWRDLVGVGALIVALACLLAPRASLRLAGVWESVDRLSVAADALWWWPWRWREILVGAPSLVLALVLVDARADAKEGCQTCGPGLLGDPRGWLALGLLAPAGTVAAIGAGYVPAKAALVQGAAAFAIGAVIGLALALLRVRVDAWVKGPIDDKGLLT
ncbi:MAG: hypothetical protein HYZ74_07865 [Elusimicrobia bacterium]|nr:hypothetical protein [Elusimicrobiota bacterium]